MHKNKYLDNSNYGFGLIELMVSISIVVLVTSIILAKHDSYNSAILLRSQAYDIALKMREVQLQAVSAVGQGGEYRNVTGLYFDTAMPNSYLVFVDADGDNFYDGGEEIGKQENIDKRFQLDEITLVGSGQQKVNAVSVIFERPNFDARFYVDKAGTEAFGASGVELGIRLKGSEGSGSGSVRTIEVSKTGQIIVQPLAAANTAIDIQDPIEPGDGGGDIKPGGEINPGSGGGDFDPPIEEES